MRIPGKLLPHSILVKPRLGTGAYGPVWGDQEEVKRCLVEDVVRTVNDSTGSQSVSNTTVYLEPRSIPSGSLVTVWPGTEFEREAEVISIGHLDHPRGMSHITLYLR